ncbi:MAG: outer membrane beta-barrel protein [Pseudomonadales bacterium]|nr:outer membrane beta-barrel protein [Pseudomonadales bacterium]
MAIGIMLAAQPAIAEIQPQAVDLGGFNFTPTIGISQSLDNNIFNQPNGRRSSGISRFTPQLQLFAQKDANTLALTYGGDYGIYANSDNDDYQDHSFSADAYLEMNSRNRFTLAASIAQLHDNRGTGSSEGAAATSRTKPDEYDLNGASALWEYGADSARFGASFNITLADIEYTNNRLETQFRDRDEVSLQARLYGRVQSKTRFFVELETRDIEYDTLPISGGSLDSDQDTFSVGVVWEATGKTTGTVKIGSTDKEFSAPSRQDADLNTWEVEVVWSPRTYSNVFFTSSSAPRETNGTGTYIESRSHQVQWLHDWSGRLHTSVSFALGNDEYDNDPRSDDRLDYSFGVNYDLERWINLGFTYSYQELDSNTAVFDYDKRIIAFSVDLSL